MTKLDDIRAMLPTGDIKDWENDACYEACAAIQEIIHETSSCTHVSRNEVFNLTGVTRFLPWSSYLYKHCPDCGELL